MRERLNKLNISTALVLCLMMICITSCQSVYTNECLWYIAPTDKQVLSIAEYDKELFKIVAQNKLKYEEACK